MIEKKLTQRDEQAVETRQRILESALEQFSLHGYHATTTRMINQSSGVSGGLLYHYFPNGKHQILSVLLDTKLSEIAQDIDEDNKRLEKWDLAKVLDYLFIRVDTLFNQHEKIIKVLFKEFDFFGNKECTLLTDKLQLRKKELPKILERRYERGEIKKIDFDRASDVLTSVMMNHLFIRILGFAGPLKDESYRKSLIDYQISLWKKNHDE